MVSLWIGNADSMDDLERYVEFPWQDGEPDLTNFCWDFGFNWFDEDFCAIFMIPRGHTNKLAMLFENFHFCDPIRDKFIALYGNELTEKYNCSILLYNYRYIPDASWVAPSCEDHTVRMEFVGTVPFEWEPK